MPSRTHKRCPMCGRTKPLGEFRHATYWSRGQQRQVSRIVAYCQPCEREYARVRYAQRYRGDAAFRERERKRRRARSRREAEERGAGRQWFRTAAQEHLAAMRERGWSLTRIAAAVGVSRAAVSGWAHGLWAPRPARLRALRRLAGQVTGRT